MKMKNEDEKGFNKGDNKREFPQCGLVDCLLGIYCRVKSVWLFLIFYNGPVSCLAH